MQIVISVIVACTKTQTVDQYLNTRCYYEAVSSHISDRNQWQYSQDQDQTVVGQI